MRKAFSLFKVFFKINSPEVKKLSYLELDIIKTPQLHKPYYLHRGHRGI